MLYAYMPTVALKRRTGSSGPGDHYWCSHEGHARVESRAWGGHATLTHESVERCAHATRRWRSVLCGPGVL